MITLFIIALSILMFFLAAGSVLAVMGVFYEVCNHIYRLSITYREGDEI